MKGFIALSFLSCLLTSAAADEVRIDRTVTNFPGVGTSYEKTVQIPRFDDALGTLTGVTFKIYQYCNYLTTITLTGVIPSTKTAVQYVPQCFVQATLTADPGTEIGASSKVESFNKKLTFYSGGTQAINQLLTGGAASSTRSTDVFPFTTAFSLTDMDLKVNSFFVHNLAFLMGPRTDSFLLSTIQSQVSISVTYTYTPIP